MTARMGGVQFQLVRLGDPLVAPLLAGLEEEYRSRYGANDEMGQTDEQEFDPPAGLFVVLVDHPPGAGSPHAVAGGGFRAHGESTCEVKRMWTHPAYRRRGLAVRVLDRLEKEAAAAGYQRLVLETGPRQPEAEAMYVARGYIRTATYGRYEEARAFAVELV